MTMKRSKIRKNGIGRIPWYAIGAAQHLVLHISQKKRVKRGIGGLNMSETPKCPGCGREMVPREDFHKFFFVCLDCGWKSPYGQNEKEGLDLALKRIEPVQHGYWIIPTPPDAYTYCKILCSVCNQVAGKHQTEYCPRCGAKMDLPRPRSNSDD